MPRRLLPLALAAAILVAHALAYLRWTEDDAAITLRYASHLASGHGLVYNLGERVEAISNLGYALLLVPVVAWASLPDQRLLVLLPVKLLGLAAAALALIEAARLARALGLGGRATVAALVLVAGSGAYAAWAVGALETPFVAWATAGLVAACAELVRDDGDAVPPRALARACAFALALTLLRVDGFVLPVALSAYLALRGRTRAAALKFGLVTGVTLATLVSFRLAYYGAPWPNPFYAKVELGASVPRLLETLGSYVLPFLRIHGGALPLVLLLSAACLGRGRFGHARRTATASVIALVGYVTLVGGDWMPLFRFLVPAVIPLLVTATAGLEALAFRLRLRASMALVLVLALGAASAEALAARSVFRTRRGVPLFWLEPRASAETLHDFWLPAVAWLRGNLDPGALLVTSEAGFVPWLSGLRTIDSYGLATREIATLPRGSVVRSPLGVDTHFTEAAPRDPASLFLAEAPAAAVVLQTAMLRSWNDGSVPRSLLGGRFQLVDGDPAGERWAIYRPTQKEDRDSGDSSVTPPGSGSR